MFSILLLLWLPWVTVDHSFIFLWCWEESVKCLSGNAKYVRNGCTPRKSLYADFSCNCPPKNCAALYAFTNSTCVLHRRRVAETTREAWHWGASYHREWSSEKGRFGFSSHLWTKWPTTSAKKPIVTRRFMKDFAMGNKQTIAVNLPAPMSKDHLRILTNLSKVNCMEYEFVEGSCGRLLNIWKPDNWATALAGKRMAWRKGRIRKKLQAWIHWWKILMRF